MLAINCPSCGAEAPLALQSNALRCPYCKHAGVLPPEVAAQLEQARQLLFSLNAQARQLNERERRALAGSHGSRALLMTAALAGAVPVLLATLVVVSMALLLSSWLGLVWWASVAFAIAITAWAILRARAKLHKRVRALTLACAATPPRVPGEPACCHVCGGPVASDVEAVVRCGYCQTDNLVSPEALSVAKEHRHAVLGDFASAVQQQASSVTTAGRLGAAGIIATGCMGPVLGFGLAFVSAISLSLCGPEPSADDRQYVLAESGGHQCYAEARASDEGFDLTSNVMLKTVATLDGLEVVDAKHIVGKRVRTQQGETGEALRVAGDYFFEGNVATVKWDASGLEVSTHISHLCLDGSPPQTN